MLAFPLLLADWVQIVILAIVFILWAVGQLVNKLTKAMKPPQPQGGNLGRNPPPPVPRPQAVDDEIEEFLRRASQNRPGQPPRPQPARPQPAQQQRPQQTAQRPPQPQRPPQQPQRGAGQRPAGQPQSRPPQPQRPSVVQAVQVVEEPQLGSGVAQHVNEFMERRTLDDDPNTQSRVEFADDLMQQHIHQAFDHKLGQLGGSTGGLPIGTQAGMAPASGAAALAALLANPGSMRTAIILHEILQPRDFDRDFPQIPAERA